METQTIEQIINVQVGGGLATTGTSIATILGIGLGLVTLSLLTWYFVFRRTQNSRKFSLKGLGMFTFMASAVAGLTFNLSQASATPTLILAANQNTINLSVPTGGGKASATINLTSGTSNTSGYALTVALAQPEAGIELSLSGGDVSTSTPITVGSAPLSLKTTGTATANDQTNVTLNFTIGSNVTSGTKKLKLSYVVTDNSAATPLTMQDLTSDYCQNSMVTYDGSNASAVLNLSDPRGDGQTYSVAKLADGNCWMLDNLKLGSTSSPLTLTSADTNIASNFILPQLTTTGTPDSDNPAAYGPVPGATNYGYLYNWSAATAGESRTSHDETEGDAPYSICPANWRLPIGGADINTGVPLPANEFNELSARMAGFPNGQDGTYLDNYVDYYQHWQHDGPFKGAFAGYWYGGFGDQGGYGYLWSSSAHPGGAGNAFYAFFSASEVYPDGSAARDSGVAVRCLLN